MEALSRYYTPQSLAALLVNSCGEITPNTIIDICAGSWNLLQAAHARWPRAKVVGVDIDPGSEGSILEDGRIWAFRSSSSGKLYDLVVANPPFHYEKPSEDILAIISENFSNHLDSKVRTRIESTMMLFNSLLVAHDGILGAIVPNSIINSQSQRSLRRYLASKFNLEKIIHLPDTAFGRSDRLHTSMVILRRSSEKSDTAVFQAYSTSRGYITKPLSTLSVQSIGEGIWTENHVNVSSDQSLVNKEFCIVRHNISSSMLHSQRGDNLFPVIHSSAISDHRIVCEKLMYTRKFPDSDYTSGGDIAVIRVGKNCGEFSVINDRESGLLTSDCVLLIKPATPSVRRKILNHLQRTSLDHLKRGVAAQYITKTDLEAFCLSALT